MRTDAFEVSIHCLRQLAGRTKYDAGNKVD
jgi:hypothetical protein